MSKRIHIPGGACNTIGGLFSACVETVDRKKAWKPGFKLPFRML